MEDVQSLYLLYYNYLMYTTTPIPELIEVPSMLKILRYNTTSSVYKMNG